MGQEISLEFIASNASRKIKMNVDCSVTYSVIDSAKDYKSKLYSVLKITSEILNEEFYCYLDSSRDFEDHNIQYSLLRAGKWEKGKVYTRQEGSEWEVEPTAPEWYKEHTNVAPLRRISLFAEANDSVNALFLSGFTPDEAFKLAEIVFKVFDEDVKYVQYSKTHVLSHEGVREISSLPEEEQEQVFGIKPKCVPCTHELFHWDSEKLEFGMHPELWAQYGSVRAAIIGYNKGHFALWETKEGKHFFANWRQDRSSSKDEYLKYSTFTRLGHKPIEGNDAKVNALFNEAQESFKEGALSYNHSGSTFYVGMERDFMQYRLSQVNGEWVREDFSLSNFTPLGVELSYEREKLTDPEYGFVVLNKVQESYKLRIEAEDFTLSRWVARLNGEVVCDIVL